MLAGGIWISPIGDAIRDVMEVADVKEVQNSYEGKTSEENLKAMFTAAESYHSSEEKYPEASSWNDDILPRLNTPDLKEGEANKKLTRPDLLGQPGKFGYAINSEAAGKYKKDLKDPKTILFFESKETSKNLSGNPSNDGKKPGKAILIDGTIVEL